MAHAHDRDDTVTAGALQSLGDGVWAWVQPDGTWWLNNAGAIAAGAADPAGSFVVDTCATADRTRRFLDAVSAATGGAPVRFAANTHEHGDHTYGNCLLPETTTLFGHPNIRDGLAADIVIEGCPPLWEPVPDWGPVTRRLPEVTVEGPSRVHLGDRVVELHHPGHPAHTTGDLIAWLPEERILFTGDLVFAKLTPLVMSGSVDGARRALEWLAAFDPQTLVPGHGPVLAGGEIPEVLDDHDRYYRFVQEVAGSASRDGLGPLEAARAADLGEFAEWADAERLVLNLHRASAESGGPPFDLLAAFGDALDYNGGPLTTHVCCTSPPPTTPGAT